MAYVMYGSSMVAGALNHRCIKLGTNLRLKVFDFPHIGGGIIMNPSIARWALILIRLSTLIAIAVSNYGLEGQTRILTKFEEATVRRPGPIKDLNVSKLYRATERQKRCAQTVGDEFVFGAVINNKCFPKLSNNVFVHSLALEFTKFNATAKNCSRTRVNYRRQYMVFKCEGVDISCLMEFGKGLRVRQVLCESVIYHKNESWLCPVYSAVPWQSEKVECRRLRARQADISGWTNILYEGTFDLETAVFGAAYGIEVRKFMEVPTGSKNITVVGLFWLIPAVYEILMVCIIAVWATVLRVKGFRVVAHDENGLARLLRRRVDVSNVRLAEWMKWKKGGGTEQWQIEDELA